MGNAGGGAGPKSQLILVVGGGIAGITAAVEAAETGHDVVLVERSPSLGGRVTKLNRYFPKLCHPTCGLEINYQRIKKNPRVKVMTLCEVTAIAGAKGDYTVSVARHPRYVNAKCTACGKCAQATHTEVPNPFNYGLDTIKAAYLPHEHAFPMRYVIAPEAIAAGEGAALAEACPYGAVEPQDSEESFELNAGAIIWATGWRPYSASKLEVYRWDQSPDIINNVEMERLAAHDGPTGGKILRPSDNQPAKKIALVQCAGSRDINHLPYCSRICCLGSLKHAAYIREQYEDAEVDIYYIDIRAHDKLESFYAKVRNDPQVRFIKSKPGHVDIGEDGRPVLCGERTIEREIYAEPYDLIVLATGMQPEAVEGYHPQVGVEQDDYGFLVANGAGDGEGIFSAGVAGGPLDVSMSVQSATAAALKAVQAVRGA